LDETEELSEHQDERGKRMTEAEWHSLADPFALFDQIRGPKSTLNLPVVATDRQLLLWASACCRRLGPVVDDARWLNAIRVVEQFADGEAAYPEVLAVGREMQKWFEELGGYQNVSPIGMVARSCADLSGGVDSAYDSMGTPFLVPAEEASRWAVAAVREIAGEPAAERERAVQCSLLHDILGNPFRPATVREGWRTPSVLTLAIEVYRGRSFGRLPELATALIQAGCEDEIILNHCRSDGPHVRGCWVVDLFLQRQFSVRWT
jgi:hypothetical protein